MMYKQQFPRVLVLIVAFLLLVTGLSLGVNTVIGAGVQQQEDVAMDVEVLLPFVAHNAYFAENIQTNCRYGVNNRPGLAANQWMATLGVGHYINFAAQPLGTFVPENIEFLPQVRVRQDVVAGVYQPSYTITPPLTMESNGLGPIILGNPNQLWLVGNEPDVTTQDGIYPDWYARAYHEVYHFIKALDPSAQVAVAGLSMMTPGRLQYLDIMWDTYLREYGEPMPVDVWNMHVYILPEKNPWDGSNSDGKIALGTDPALAKIAPSGPPAQECPLPNVHCRAEHDDLEIFKQQILNMRLWMKAHGQQNKPLLLTEFSLLYPFVDYDDPVNPTQCYLMDEFGRCFTPARVVNYLRDTIHFLETAQDRELGYAIDGFRLVQQWAWFSMYTPPDTTGGSSNLLRGDYLTMPPGEPAALTPVGQAYLQVAHDAPTTVNLVAATVETSMVERFGNPTLRFRIGFFNNGSNYVKEPFLATVYRDEARLLPVGSGEVRVTTHGIINGCSWGRVTDWVDVFWRLPPPGTHQVWIRLDSRNDIKPERTEADNIMTVTVTVDPY